MTARARPAVGLILVIAVAVFSLLAVAGCEGAYVVTGERTSSSASGRGGEIDVRIDSAKGTSTKDLEVDFDGATLDAEVTLAVGEGTFKIELLGADDAVTLTLEAGAGEHVRGSGTMVTDTFGEASYRVTAAEAKDVSYHITWRVR